MDEPFGALDAQTRGQMQAYLKQIWMNVDVTIIFITHDLDEAVYMADRIIVLAGQPGPHRRDHRGAADATASAPEALFYPRFIATRLRVDEWIHPKENQVEKHPVKRMTPPGDEVL